MTDTGYRCKQDAGRAGSANWNDRDEGSVRRLLAASESCDVLMARSSVNLWSTLAQGYQNIFEVSSHSCRTMSLSRQ
jgi:hypothetical protein